MIIKKCNKADVYQHHENRCPHRKTHSAYTIECDPKLRESAGLQTNCRWYSDQQCEEILLQFKEVNKR